jgi:serine/threonine-protein kinase
MVPFGSTRALALLGPEAMPKRIGRYEIRGLLGQGAMGRVYLAYDPKLSREVAIKSVGQEFAQHARARERFHREARAVAALKHPSIVEIFDYSGEGSAEIYLVMEKIVGPDLFALVDKRGPMPEAVAAAIVHELCRALEHAHASGVIHRDLKPENVLVEWNGRVVLTDFGLVKAFAPHNTLGTRSYGHTDVIGTPGFMAPEQARGEPLGPHTDVFALGAMYYNLLTARLPFPGNTPFLAMQTAQQGKYDDPRLISPEISDTTIALLADCLDAQPKKRLQSMRVIRDRLMPIFRACGMTDARDEIARYLRAPEAHANELRWREVRLLRDRIKLATLDGDMKRLSRLRQRLKLIAGTTNPDEPGVPRRRFRKRWLEHLSSALLAIVAGLVLGAVFGLAFGKPAHGHGSSPVQRLIARVHPGT